MVTPEASARSCNFLFPLPIKGILVAILRDVQTLRKKTWAKFCELDTSGPEGRLQILDPNIFPLLTVQLHIRRQTKKHYSWNHTRTPESKKLHKKQQKHIVACTDEDQCTNTTEQDPAIKLRWEYRAAIKQKFLHPEVEVFFSKHQSECRRKTASPQWHTSL